MLNDDTEDQPPPISGESEESRIDSVRTGRGRPSKAGSPPTEEKTVAEMFASYSNEVTYNEDINTPTVDEWDDL